MTDAQAAIALTHREEWARIVAGLTRQLGDLDVAEDMAAEAFAAAAERWPRDGVPPNPGAWLMVTARRKAVDRLRREALRYEKHVEAQFMHEATQPMPSGVVDDDRLRLLFTCCHPALALDARVALTLRTVGGLTVAEIARAFLVQDTTMGQRISRAKAKIKAAKIPFRIPSEADLPVRIGGVLTALYLIFNEGYLTTQAESDPIRDDLTREALRLTRLVHELLPTHAEVQGLLALMLLIAARRPARLSASGDLVRLAEQNRAEWDEKMIAEGLDIVRQSFTRHRRGGTAPGRYLIMAAINAVHARAPRAVDTDWPEIVSLYAQLERIDPNPIVTLNKAIAVAEAESPEDALEIVDPLSEPLADYPGLHVTRAELLRSCGRTNEAIDAYDRAIALATNAAEIIHLRTRRGELSPRNA